MTDEPKDKPMVVDLAPGGSSGSYADFVAVWHTRDVFTLDFAAFRGPVGGGADRRAEVVSRVRIPPSQVFELMKALETQLSQWERGSGTPPPTSP